MRRNMYGYIIVNKPELKIKEFDAYRSYYCGLCKELKRCSGNISRLTLSYDMTFLYILLTGLYEPKTLIRKENCIFHPVHKPFAAKNCMAEYVADMSVLMAYYKGRDDWRDDKNPAGGFLTVILDSAYRAVKIKYFDKVKLIEAYMEELDRGEKINNYNIDYMSGLFGKVMGEVFVYKNDEWETYLRRMGFYLGKFIYLMDAYEDIYEDIKNKNYNPFMKMYGSSDFERKAEDILLMMMTECSSEFEKLPVIKNAELLRNILYSGVWVKYEKIKKDRYASKEGIRRKHDKSV